MPFDWAGTEIIQKNTALPDKRRMFDNRDQYVPTDLREWVTPSDRAEIRRALNEMSLPTDRTAGTFDERALTVWHWVLENIEYAEDPEQQRAPDFWQFPAETLAVKRGDCEDCAFLLASLLLGSGISAYCVRVVLGTVTVERGEDEPHAWVVYKEESGRWCLLEATSGGGALPDKFPSAEVRASKQTGDPTYTPTLCLNADHIWQIGRRHAVPDVSAFVREFSKKKKKRHKLQL